MSFVLISLYGNLQSFQRTHRFLMTNGALLCDGHEMSDSPCGIIGFSRFFNKFVAHNKTLFYNACVPSPTPKTFGADPIFLDHLRWRAFAQHKNRIRRLNLLLFLFQAFLSRAAYYGMKGRYSKGIMSCNEAIKLQPRSVRAYLYRFGFSLQYSAYLS